MDPQVCPACQFPIAQNNYFCPNCGKKIKNPPVSTTIGKQIGVYGVSIFLPPFGIVPAIRYLSQPDPKGKMIGYIALALTIVSTAVSIWLTIITINKINSTLNSQLMLQYQGY